MILNSDIDKQLIRSEKKLPSGMDLEYDEIINSFDFANQARPKLFISS